MFSKVEQTSERSHSPASYPAMPHALPRAMRPRSLNEGLELFSSVSEYLRFNELIERASQDRDDLTILCERLQVAQVRDKVLPVLIHRPALIKSPLKRAPVLESLFQFADESLVREYALTSLESGRFDESRRVLAAAGRILIAGGSSLEARQIKRIAALAGKLGDKEERLVASAAQYVLHHLPASPVLTSVAIGLAHEWFLARKTGENPWLSILSKYPSHESFRFLRDVVRGVVPHSKEPSVLTWLLKGSLNLHSMAAMAGTVGVVVNKAFALAGVVGRISSVQAFCISAGLLYLGKIGSQILFDELANSDRNFERVEAIAHISLMHDRVRRERGAVNNMLTEEASSFLSEASNDGSQKPIVREAAHMAHLTPFEPSELWTQVLES